MKIITQKVLSLILTCTMLFAMVQATGVTAFAVSGGDYRDSSARDSNRMMLFADSNVYSWDNNRTVLYIDRGNITIGNGTVSGYNVDGQEVTDHNPDGYVITQTAKQ